MRALVVVESVFGNTRGVADAVAAGLAERMDVRTVDVGTAPADLGGIDLLVVGGPTHAFGMTRPSTRQSAAEQAAGAVPAAETGLREWLERLPDGTCPAATFDTRMNRPRLPGSAAGAAARRLRRAGHRLVARPETFRVTGSQGPLLDGEQARARRWGEVLAAELTAR
ncbi:flavodoxin family protein [Pseudonocardia saturnea]